MKLPSACKCGGLAGVVDVKNGCGHVGLYCQSCGRWHKWVSRVDAGLSTRSVQSTHESIKPAKRARIIQRANGACELCRKANTPIHVGHLLSVKDGHSLGLTDSEINSDENLAAMCEECNLGVGSGSIPVRLMVALIKARTKNYGGL